jgi:SAM-dependent methyltransferase
LEKSGYSVRDKVVFEVGSGHELISPLGWFINGADSVVTVDLNRRLDLDVFRGSLSILGNLDELVVYEKYFDNVEKLLCLKRLGLVRNFMKDPEKFMKNSKIEYLAPANAANVSLSDSSVDIHFSNTVFEHISKKSLFEILKEGRRILKPDGVFLHNIDLSDHFSHTDESICKINFLKYGKAMWLFIGGNRFAYCNRLRVSEYRTLFESAGLEIIAESSVIDSDSVSQLEGSLGVNRIFRNFSNEELATISVTILAKVAIPDEQYSRNSRVHL